jgi:hypothetical protein
MQSGRCHWLVVVGAGELDDALTALTAHAGLRKWQVLGGYRRRRRRGCAMLQHLAGPTLAVWKLTSPIALALGQINI